VTSWLAVRAAEVLRANDLGSMTAASPRLYPHMWSWDAAIVAMGLATFDIDRALAELDTLLSGQWSTGMIPHIVFAVDRTASYLPGPDRWDCRGLAPSGRQTSGIIQPPVHAIAVQRILDRARTSGRSERVAAEEFVRRRWGDLMRWHRWLAEMRDPAERGRVTIYHGWESGMDNSPRWDAAYANVIPGPMPPYVRSDLKVVTDLSQRPSDGDYDRYLWLIEEMKSVRYEADRLPEVMSFAVEDVFVSAIFAVACEVLAEVGEDRGSPEADVRDLREWAQRFRGGVIDASDETTGAARDFDLRADAWISTETAAQFAPLLCGGLSPQQRSTLLELLNGPRFRGHPDLKSPLIPSTSPESKDFRPRQYWRGPVWPVLNWLFSWAAARYGLAELSCTLQTEGLRQAGDCTFAEYYEPFTGEPLGSRAQSWTSAVVLDWLA